MDRKLRILGIVPNSGGCSFYRCIQPLKLMERELGDKVEIRFTENPLQFDEATKSAPPNDQLVDLNWCDVAWMSNIQKYGGNYTARTAQVVKELGKFLHFDTDDLLTELYEDHKLFGVYKDNKLDEVTKFVYNISDLVTVTQNKFAMRIQPFVGKVMAVVKNTLDYSLPCWNVPRVPSKRCRIGWAAGIHHIPDVKVFESVPHLINQKCGRENIAWHFLGHPPPDPNKPKGWEDSVWPEYRARLLNAFKGQPNYSIFYALPPDAYGGYFANMDVSIAPLQMNAFNDSKSDIKVAEASRYKIPLVASNVGCYNETIQNGKTGYLIEPDAPKTEWVRILSKLVKDPKHRVELGNNLHEATKDLFDGAKNAKERYNLYLRAFQDTGYQPK